MKRYFLPVLLVLSLSSCIGIESQISVGSDGSGTLRLDYRISQFLREDRTLPLPVSREDFQRAVSVEPGLSLVALNQREDEQDVYIDARIGFDRVEALNALGGSGQIGLSYTVEGDKHILRQRVYPGQSSQGISAESLKMIETFFQGYELSYLVSAPAPIQAHTLGELSEDRRSLRYRTTIPELLKQKDEVILEVIW